MAEFQVWANHLIHVLKAEADSCNSWPGGCWAWLVANDNETTEISECNFDFLNNTLIMTHVCTLGHDATFWKVITGHVTVVSFAWARCLQSLGLASRIQPFRMNVVLGLQSCIFKLSAWRQLLLQSLTWFNQWLFFNSKARLMYLEKHSLSLTWRWYTWQENLACTLPRF
jgi:hypothetical protein